MSPHRFASVILVDNRGWVLLQERDEHPDIDPGKWGFVGGGVEAGEDFRTAAYRELGEETGVEIDDGLELYGTFSVFHEHCGQDDEFQLWAMGTDLGDGDIECHEGRQICFVDPDELGSLELTASATVALRGFLDSDHYRRLVP